MKFSVSKIENGLNIAKKWTRICIGILKICLCGIKDKKDENGQRRESLG